MDYKQAGVDVDLGDRFVAKIKKLVSLTYDDRVVSGVGGFAALYDLGRDRYLAAGTDGVGTKVKLAQELGKHDTIGQDLVAMCANDIACTGARALFFLDYLACHKLEPDILTEVVAGIARACKVSGLALIGGETAEMPGVYAPGVYDLAGFAVGEVYREKLLGGDKVQAGNHLIGIAASGFHSNGYSLVRQLLKQDEHGLKEKLLTPTRLYAPLVQTLIAELGDGLTGVSHITGGGFENIARMNAKLAYRLNALPRDDFRSDEMNEIIRRSGLSQEKSYKTFNMGVGLVIAVKDRERADAVLRAENERIISLGYIEDGASGLYFPS